MKKVRMTLIINLVLNLKDECLPHIITSLNQDNVDRYISKNEDEDYCKLHN